MLSRGPIKQVPVWEKAVTCWLTGRADTGIACHGSLQASSQRHGLHCCHCWLGPALQQRAEVVIDPAAH